MTALRNDCAYAKFEGFGARMMESSAKNFARFACSFPSPLSHVVKFQQMEGPVSLALSSTPIPVGFLSFSLKLSDALIISQVTRTGTRSCLDGCFSKLPQNHSKRTF